MHDNESGGSWIMNGKMALEKAGGDEINVSAEGLTLE